MKEIKGKRSEVEKIVVNLIKKKIKKILSKKDSVILGIPGGRSILGIFNLFKKENILWNKIHIFMVDERIVNIKSKDSNFRLAKENFIDELLKKNLIKKNQVHPFFYNKRKKDFGIREYTTEFFKYSDNYDIVILSSGEDGHIASLFPNHPSIKNNSKSFILVKNSPRLPKLRMSASKNLLSKSKTAFLLFFGEEKRLAYKRFLDKNISLESCPAKVINYTKDSYLLTDLK